MSQSINFVRITVCKLNTLHEFVSLKMQRCSSISDYFRLFAVFSKSFLRSACDKQVWPLRKCMPYDSSMGTLGVERLPGRLFCDMSLCYGHLAMSVACRINCFFLFPSDENTLSVHNNGLQDWGFSSQQPLQLWSLSHSIYETAECKLAPELALNCNLPTSGAKSALTSIRMGQNQIPVTVGRCPRVFFQLKKQSWIREVDYVAMYSLI